MHPYACQLLLFTLVVLASAPCVAHDFGDVDHIDTPVSLQNVEDHLRQYRQTGDDAWLVAIDAFWATLHPGKDNSVQALLLKAWHAQAQHRFRDASRYVEQVLAQGQQDMTVWLLLANLKRVMGDQDAANSACRQVLARQIVLGRLCIASQAGHPAAVEMAQLSQLPNALPRDRDLRAWAFATLSDIYSLAGWPDAATEAARAAFMLQPTVNHRARLGSLLLANGEPEQTLKLVGGRFSPALLLLQLKAHAALNTLDQQSSLIQRTDERFRADVARGDFLHAREMASFYFDILPDPALAKHLSRLNWAAQREREDLLLLNRANTL